MSGYEALVQLARPLLLPNPGSNQLDKLRRAVDLGRSPEYQDLRDAYFKWFRDATKKLHPDDPSDLDFCISPASLAAISSQLEELFKQEQDVVRKLSGRKRWDRAETGCMAVTAAAGITSVAFPPAAVATAIVGAVANFAGWAIPKWRRPAEGARELTGASMFVEANRKLAL